jgi:hypothetical protein
MSITILQNPPNISFGKNAMPLVLRSDSYKIRNATTFTTTARFSAQPVQGTIMTFRFDWIDTPILTFTFTSNPIGVFDLPLGDIFQASYINLLITRLNRHYIFDKYYNLSAAPLGRGILFTAKEAGRTPNMSSGGTWVGSVSLTTIGTEAQYLPNYSFHVDLYIEDTYKSGKFIPVATMEGKPDDAGRAVFNLAPRLESFLNPRMPSPSTIKRLEIQNNKQYYFVAAESFGDNPAPSLIRKSTTRRVLRGGLDDFGHKRFNHRDAKKHFENKWITHWPIEREITEEQPQYLSLFYPGLPTGRSNILKSGGQGLNIFCEVTYKDGTTNEFILHNATEALADETFTFSVGIINNPTLRSMNAAKEIQSYAVEAWANGRLGSYQITQKVNFKVVPSHYQDLFLIYENSLGAWETVRVNGARKSKVEVKKEEYSRIQDITNTDRKTIFHQMESYSEPLAVTTGPIDPDVHNLMLELFTSEDIVLVTPKGYLPVEISSDKYDFENTAENVKSHEFVIRRSQYERNYPVEGIAGKEVEEMDEKIETIGDEIIKRP